MLLLSDQGNEVRERDREATEVGKEVEEGRKGVAGVVSRLMRQSRAEDVGGMDVDIRDTENSTGKNQGGGAQAGEGVQAGEEDEEDEDDEDEDEGFEQVA
jgi:hypothetical protein